MLDTVSGFLCSPRSENAMQGTTAPFAVSGGVTGKALEGVVGSMPPDPISEVAKTAPVVRSLLWRPYYGRHFRGWRQQWN